MTLRRTFEGILVVSGGALYALPLMAEESGDKGGLPQLDASLFPEQLFWLAITFGLLYILMAFVALPGVKRTKDNRQSIITTELAAATAANEAAKATIATYEKTLADARANAQKTVTEITTEAAKISAEKQAVQQKELGAQLDAAEAKIYAARDAALKDLKDASTELAQAIVEKVTGLRVKA